MNMFLRILATVREILIVVIYLIIAFGIAFYLGMVMGVAH